MYGTDKTPTSRKWLTIKKEMNVRKAPIHLELRELKELSLASLAKELKTNAFFLRS